MRAAVWRLMSEGVVGFKPDKARPRGLAHTLLRRTLLQVPPPLPLADARRAPICTAPVQVLGKDIKSPTGIPIPQAKPGKEDWYWYSDR